MKSTADSTTEPLSIWMDEASRVRVLQALQEILALDSDLALRAVARRRYIELRDRGITEVIERVRG